MMRALSFLLLLFPLSVLGFSQSYSKSSSSNNNNNNNNDDGDYYCDDPQRRAVFTSSSPLLLAVAATTTTSLLFPPTVSFASSSSIIMSDSNPLPPQSITTVVLDSPDSRIGVQLSDVSIITTTSMKKKYNYAVVKSVQEDGLAYENGVKEGMIILGSRQDSSSSSSSAAKSVVNQIKNGPYPIVLQFYSLAEEMGVPTAAEGINRAIEETSKASEVLPSNKPPPLSNKGDGLKIKVIRKGDCTTNNKNKQSSSSGGGKVQRGDVVTINFEARVASIGGPIYDSSINRGGRPITFTIGDGKAISGVDIGMGGMCPGEIRELDIPAGLGYGRFGSQVFDIPGDVRLWWRIELLEMTVGDKKFRR